MTEQQIRKQAIRSFMQNHYTDERLCQLLAHARDGKLNYVSCCCFIGVHNAPHSLQDRFTFGSSKHFLDAYSLPGGLEANNAYDLLTHKKDDSQRQRILIPMIRAEMKRREVLRYKKELEQELQEVCT